MGAYAAIKYSALLGLTHTLAYCPQWSIDPAECGARQSGFGDHYRPEMAGMGVRSPDLRGEITVFYDPTHSYDAYHFGVLRALSERSAQCRLWACLMPHAGHNVAPILAGSARTTALFAAAYRCDLAQLCRIAAPARRASPYRRTNLLVAASARHPRLTLQAACQIVREGQTHLLHGAGCLRLHSALQACGGPDLAGALTTLLLPPHVRAACAPAERGSRRAGLAVVAHCAWDGAVLQRARDLPCASAMVGRAGQHARAEARNRA